MSESNLSLPLVPQTEQRTKLLAADAPQIGAVVLQKLEQGIPSQGDQDTFDPNNAGGETVEFDISNVDDLQRRAGELRSIGDVERGLELAILGVGLQVMAENYGADRLITAMQSPGVDSFKKVIENLEPEKSARDELYGAIENESLPDLSERINKSVGGAAYVLGGFGLFRKTQLNSLKGKSTYHGNNLLPTPNKGGLTDSGNLLLGGGFDELLKSHPELVEGFRGSNDTTTLLAGVRQIYTYEYAQLVADLERAKSVVETMVEVDVAAVTKLEDVAVSVYDDELAALKEKIAAAEDEDVRALLRQMLDDKASAVRTTTDEFKIKKQKAREGVVAKLGADRLDRLHVLPLPRTELIDLADEKNRAA